MFRTLVVCLGLVGRSYLGETETLLDGLHSVPSVGIPGHVLIDALNPHLKPGAAITQHVLEVWSKAVVRPGLNG